MSTIFEAVVIVVLCTAAGLIGAWAMHSALKGPKR